MPGSSSLTLHFRHVPCPPQVESIAIPFQLAASNSITPGGTLTLRPAGSKTRSNRPIWPCGDASLPMATGARFAPARTGVAGGLVIDRRKLAGSGGLRSSSPPGVPIQKKICGFYGTNEL